MSVGRGIETRDRPEYGWEAVPAILVREGGNLETGIRAVAVESEKWASLLIVVWGGRARKSFRRTAWCPGSLKKS